MIIYVQTCDMAPVRLLHVGSSEIPQGDLNPLVLRMRRESEILPIFTGTAGTSGCDAQLRAALRRLGKSRIILVLQPLPHLDFLCVSNRALLAGWWTAAPHLGRLMERRDEDDPRRDEEGGEAYHVDSSCVVVIGRYIRKDVVLYIDPLSL